MLPTFIKSNQRLISNFRVSMSTAQVNVRPESCKAETHNNCVAHNLWVEITEFAFEISFFPHLSGRTTPKLPQVTKRHPRLATAHRLCDTRVFVWTFRLSSMEAFHGLLEFTAKPHPGNLRLYNGETTIKLIIDKMTSDCWDFLKILRLPESRLDRWRPAPSSRLVNRRGI